MSTTVTAVEKLKTAADEAYALHPKSCSHAVWHVIKQYLPDQPYVVANTLLSQIAGDARWKPVSINEIEKLVNEGTLIVGGRAETTNGHVIVVYPGAAKTAGGYPYTQGGAMKTLRPRGLYPLAMSTSLGSWPGAVSKGDKTIWDPWANDGKFSTVKFWRLELKK